MGQRMLQQKSCSGDEEGFLWGIGAGVVQGRRG